MAGENLAAGMSVVRALNSQGIKGTLNHVGTHVHTESEAIAAADAIIRALDAIHAEGLESHVSIKLTQLGLDIDEALTSTQLCRVTARAADLGIFIRIDMEESRYVKRTIELFEEVRGKYGDERVGIVLQSYLRDRPTDLARLLDGGSRIRLVKGGYWEPSTVVYRTRSDIDRAFMRDIKTLLERGRHPAIATHDTAAIYEACRVAAGSRIDKGSYEFQMLYGVRSDLQIRLVSQGYVVRCYVPYGDQWFPYFLGCVRRMPGGATRRLRERVGHGGRQGQAARTARVGSDPDGTFEEPAHGWTRERGQVRCQTRPLRSNEQACWTEYCTSPISDRNAGSASDQGFVKTLGKFDWIRVAQVLGMNW